MAVICGSQWDEPREGFLSLICAHMRPLPGFKKACWTRYDAVRVRMTASESACAIGFRPSYEELHHTMACRPSTDQIIPTERQNRSQRQDEAQNADSKCSISGQDYMQAIDLYSELKTSDFLYPGHLYREVFQLRAKGLRSWARDRVPAMVLITMDNTGKITRQFYHETEKCIDDIKSTTTSENRSKILFVNGYM